MPGYVQIDYIGLSTRNVSMVFYTLWSHVRVQLDSIALPSLSFPIVFYFTRFGGMSGYRLTPLDWFTRFGSMSGYRLTPMDRLTGCF